MDSYHIVELEPRHYWAKAQYDWESNSGDNRVQCFQCDRDGSNERSTDIWVYLPRNADCDPTVFQGDVIGFSQADGGVLACCTAYSDGSKIGDTKWVKSEDNVRPGWREMDGQDASWDMRHRVAMGRDPDGEDNEKVLGGSGGFRWHGQTEEDGTANNHADHEVAQSQKTYTLDAAGTAAVDSLDDLVPGESFVKLPHGGPFNTDKDCDNRMPFRVGIGIERYK